MAKITYLLGAGASAKAMPVVSEIPIATSIVRDFFKEILLNIQSGNPYPEFIECMEHEDKIERIVETLSIFHIILLNHSSVDTFFKKIHLTKQTEIEFDDNGNKVKVKADELLGLYNLILLFIDFETYKYVFNELNNLKNIKLVPAINSNNLTEEEKEKISFRNSKASLDLRYDTFLATVLKEIDGNIQLDDDITIVSWNYDTQLERAITNYLVNDSKQNVNNILKPEVKFFKLNGTSWPHIDGGKNETSFDKLGFQNFKNKSSFDLPDYIIEFLKSTDYNHPFNQYKFNKNLYFQWNSILDLDRGKAFEAVKETDVLVVIGYTFPTFNREVDRRLYRSMEKLKKIYIVDINEKRINSIRSSFNALLNANENIDTEGIYVYVNALRLTKEISQVNNRTIRYSGNPRDSNTKAYIADIFGVDDVSQFFIPPEF